MERRIIRLAGMALGLLALPFAGQTAGVPSPATQRSATPSYDFSYRLSGDRRVAPIQVFDDGRTTWLQFQPGQTLPAVFIAQAPDVPGDLATYTQQGPYLVLTGTASSLLMRIGTITARADYVGKAARVGLAAASAAVPSQWSEDTGVGASAVPRPAMPPDPGSSRTNAQARHAQAAALATTPAAAFAPSPVAVLDASSTAVPLGEASFLEFDVSPADKNMRTALDRWARQAGWMFSSEHWAADVDIPLAGVAAFGADFRHAVRSLLAATELADRPLQPCFYSNRVLRVVPLSQACDRTTAPALGAMAQS